MNDKPIQLRGHHLLVLSSFLRDGSVFSGIIEYGPYFLWKERKLLKIITQNLQQKIQLTDTIDDICKNCCFKGLIQGGCSSKKAASGDNFIIKQLGLTLNEVYESSYLIQKIKQEQFGY